MDDSQPPSSQGNEPTAAPPLRGTPDRVSDAATCSHHPSNSGSGSLEVRCPDCREPIEVAVDTKLTDLTCSTCGSHFSLIDQATATRMAPALSTLGRFELTERIGVGGFGSVWKARDKQLDRTVAIKIPRQGEMTAEEQEKFFREARAAAQLHHPNIVSVYEVGRDGDSVFIVSDFVRGVTLGDWLSGQQVTSREAAELCAKIADALEHAHENGVVHRDLKPANIMMDGDGEPHLMDFGLARREVGEVTVTMDGHVLGTPAYMSPEQAEGKGHQADRRSDVYSLGVILFQLLTGELPFRGNARMLMHQVIHDEPPSPRKLNANVSKDLETATLKCLEKDPGRRYQSAQEFAVEMRRYLAGEPIHARPIGSVAKAWRWAKRKPAIAGLAFFACASLLAGTVVSTMFAAKASRNAEQAFTALEQAKVQTARADENATKLSKQADDLRAAVKDSRRNLVRALIEKGSRFVKDGDYWPALLWYIKAWELDDAGYLREESHRLRVAGILSRCPQLTGVCFHDGGGINVAIVNGGAGLATSKHGNKLAYVWDPKESGIVHRFAHEGEIYCLCAEPSGPRLVICSKDGVAKIWDTVSGRQLGPDLRHQDAVTHAAFSPDGKLLATTSFDRTARLWRLNDDGATMEHEFDVGRLGYFVDFSPDGKLLVALDDQGACHVWNIATAEKVVDTESVRGHAEFNDPWGIYALPRFTADGATMIAAGPGNRSVSVWDLQQGKEVDRIRRDYPVNRVELLGGDGDQLAITGSGIAEIVRRSTKSQRSLDYDGRISYLAGADRDGTRLFMTTTRGYLHSTDTKSLKPLSPVIKQGSQITSLQVSADGRTVLTGSIDGTARLWRFDDNRGFQDYRYEGGSVDKLSAPGKAFGPDGKFVARILEDDQFVIERRSTGEKITEPIEAAGPIRQFGFVTNDRIFTLAANQLQFWRSADGQPAGKPFAFGVNVESLVFSGTGQWLAAIPSGGNSKSKIQLTVFHVGDEIERIRVLMVANRPTNFSPDEQSIAVWTYDGVVAVRRLSDDAELATCVGQRGGPDVPIFSPDGKLLLTSSTDQYVRVWNVETSRLHCPPLPHSYVRSAAFRDDGKAVVTVDRNCDAVIWDTDTGDPMVSGIRAPSFNATRAWFASGGKALVLADDKSHAVEWRLPSIRGSVQHVGALARLLSGQKIDLERGVDFVSPKEFIENRTDYYQAWLDTQGRKAPDIYAAFPALKTFMEPSIAELRASIGRELEVTFSVKRTGGTTNLYLNSHVDWQNQDCFSVQLVPKAIEAIQARGVTNPRTQLVGKRVRCRGVLALEQGKVVMTIDDPTKQFDLVDDGDSTGSAEDPEIEYSKPTPYSETTVATAYITPSVDELRKSEGREQTVTFRVQGVGGQSHVYLNSLRDYRHPDCFTVEILPADTESLAKWGSKSGKELMGKFLECRGKVSLFEGKLRIVVTDVKSQLRIVDEPTRSADTR